MRNALGTLPSTLIFGAACRNANREREKNVFRLHLVSIRAELHRGRTLQRGRNGKSPKGTENIRYENRRSIWEPRF